MVRGYSLHCLGTFLPIFRGDEALDVKISRLVKMMFRMQVVPNTKIKAVQGVNRVHTPYKDCARYLEDYCINEHENLPTSRLNRKKHLCRTSHDSYR